MREKIKLVSSAGTGHFYTTTKNKKTMPDKFEIKKFDPTIKKYVMYKESKIKQTYLTTLYPLRLTEKSTSDSIPADLASSHHSLIVSINLSC